MEGAVTKLRPITEKRRKFGILIAKGRPKCAAYKESHNPIKMTDRMCEIEAVKLLKNPTVALFIKEMQLEASKRSFITVESIRCEYDEVRDLAIRDGQYGVALQATTNKAKLFGLLDDKVKHEMNVNVNMDYEGLISKLHEIAHQKPSYEPVLTTITHKEIDNDPEYQG
jgi:hypothetical protein